MLISKIYFGSIFEIIYDKWIVDGLEYDTMISIDQNSLRVSSWLNYLWYSWCLSLNWCSSLNWSLSLNWILRNIWWLVDNWWSNIRDIWYLNWCNAWSERLSNDLWSIWIGIINWSLHESALLEVLHFIIYYSLKKYFIYN